MIANNITFQLVQEHDLALLYQWFQEAHVTKWWPTPQQQENFFTDFLTRIRSKTTKPLLVLHNSIPFAYLQYYHIAQLPEQEQAWLPPLPKTTIGCDQFIGDPNFLYKGYGTAMLQAFFSYIHRLEPEITTVIVDPEPENVIAIACYKKAGFVPIGIYKSSKHTALIMRYDFS